MKNKIKTTTFYSKKHNRFATTALRVFAVAIVSGAIIVGYAFPNLLGRTSAQQASCASIADCQQQIANNDKAVADLQSQAVSYQDAVDRLNGQIVILQGSIDTNLHEQASLQQQINDAQAKLDVQKQYLGESVKGMYVKGDLTTVEMLATSKNLSAFVDGETYRAAVQAKIQQTLKTITKLQNELKDKKGKIDDLLRTQQSQQTDLNNARAEQAKLLAYNQDQQNAYNSQTAANQQKLNQLIEAQRRANDGDSTAGLYFLRFPGAVGRVDPGAYPYANAGFGMSTAPGCVDNDGPDPWGYCTRQCVSFAAWAVQASGRQAPMYYGNAKDWVSAARADFYKGVRVYTSGPAVGDVLISTAGTWGHAMYVIGVSGNQVHIAEYNQQLNGRLRTDRWVTYQ